MMQQEFHGNPLSKDAAELLRTNGIDPKNMKDSDAKKLLSNLDKQDADRINRLLNDKEELNRLLNSDAAKQIMTKLFGAGGAK